MHASMSQCKEASLGEGLLGIGGDGAQQSSASSVGWLVVVRINVTKLDGDLKRGVSFSYKT